MKKFLVLLLLLILSFKLLPHIIRYITAIKNNVLKSIIVVSLLFNMIFMCGINSFAQEICNNGIDDNGDGLIDCYDPLCDGTPVCNYFFTGKPVIDCKIIPPVEPLSLVWETPFNIETRSTLAVGDIDGDGVPEVVCFNGNNAEIYVLDGTNGTVELTIDAGNTIYFQNAGPVIADTDGDGFGEIYIVTQGGPLLKCFEHDGTPKFVASVPVNNREETASIADFDGNGIAEVYVGNMIYNALTGAFIASGGGGSRGNNPGMGAAYPVAADVLPDSACADCVGLELVCGNTVYAVNVIAGTMIPQPNTLPPGLTDGWTSIADMDLDGLLDVIVVSPGIVYVWNPRTGLQMGNTFNIPNTSSLGGRANIADYDNDSIPEIGVGGLHRYVVIDVDPITNTLSQKWINTIVDASRATTGSAFDFEGDGFSEVVYRDENNLYVWDGATGNVKFQIPCGSATRTEYPTIVDVNGDGHANIVCICSANNQGANGKVKVFQSASNLWIPTRRLMNQHTYSVVNINDDLSVPTNQQNHALLPKLNNFLAQTPLRDINWDPILIPVADVTVSMDTLIFTNCDSVNVTLTFCNQGDEDILPGMNISFYDGDPLFGGTLIATDTTINSILIDSCITATFTIPFSSSFTLYAYANDIGNDPLNAPRISFIECDTLNNFDTAFIQLNTLLTAGFVNTGACVNALMQFTDSSTIIAGNIVAWSWYFGDGDTSTLQNPAHMYVTDSAYNVTLIVTSDISCVDTIVLQIGVYPLPVADFTTNDACLYDSAGFTDLSTVSNGSINTWNWDFGDGDSSTIQNPAHLYTNAGVYTVTLIVSSGVGCLDTISKNAERYSIPIADFSPVIVCLKDTTRFTDLSSVNNDSIVTWIWNFGDGSPPVYDQNPEHVFSLGTYNVNLVVISSNNCINDTTKLVGVYPIPVAGFENTSPCLGSPTQFTDTSTIITGTIVSWDWDFGDGTGTSSNSDTAYSFGTDGSYIVQLIVTSDNGCKDTIDYQVEVFPLPIANFTGDTVCPESNTNFADLSTINNGTIVSWQWDFDDGDVSFIQNPTHQYTTGNTYNVSLTVTSNKSCTDTMILPVVVYPEPIADFWLMPETTTILAPLINFTDRSLGDSIVSRSWNFGDGETSIVTDPAHTYGDTGVYPVRLEVTTINGCVDDTTLFVVIKSDNTLFMPTAFSPNSRIKENQYFLPRGIGFDENNFEMYIYDRWGDLIYETQDINKPWDGRANDGGKIVQQDVYIWLIYTKDYLGKRHQYVGHVTLIR